MQPNQIGLFSKAMVALLLSGASATAILNQFLDEKEGNSLIAYQDAGGVWTVCRGITYIDKKPVKQGLQLTQQQCDELNQKEAQQAIYWVKNNIHLPLTDVQIAGIASFCPYNIGPQRCFSSTFYKKLNAGDRRGACREIKRWVFDKGRDCRKTQGQINGCYGQVSRREQEAALACWGIDDE